MSLSSPWPSGRARRSASLCLVFTNTSSQSFLSTRKIRKVGRTVSDTIWVSTNASSKSRGRAAGRGRGITGHWTRPVRTCSRRGTTGGAAGWSGRSDLHQRTSSRGNPCSEGTVTVTWHRLSTCSPASWTTPGRSVSRPLPCPTRPVRWRAATWVQSTWRRCQPPPLITPTPACRAWRSPAWWTLTTAWVTIITRRIPTMPSSWARPPRPLLRSPPVTERAFSSRALASPRSSQWCTALTGNTRPNTRRYTRGLIFKVYQMVCVKWGLWEWELIPVISKQNQEYFLKRDHSHELFGSSWHPQRPSGRSARAVAEGVLWNVTWM